MTCGECFYLLDRATNCLTFALNKTIAEVQIVFSDRIDCPAVAGEFKNVKGRDASILSPLAVST